MPATPERQSEIRSELAQFCGTETYYKTLDQRLFYTDGVRAMAERCQAYWLIDLIASHQPQARKDPRLRGMQAWRLEVSADAAVAYCCEDTPRLEAAKIRQDIGYTSFPLDAIDLWVSQNSGADWVLLLPSEY